MLDRTLTTQANSLGILRVSILTNPPTSTATLEKCSYVYSITVELYFSIWVCGSLKESQIWSKYFMSIVYYCRNNVFYSLIKSQFLDIKWFMILLISHLLSLYLFIWKLPVVKKRKWIVLYTRMPQSFRFLISEIFGWISETVSEATIVNVKGRFMAAYAMVLSREFILSAISTMQETLVALLEYLLSHHSFSWIYQSIFHVLTVRGVLVLQVQFEVSYCFLYCICPALVRLKVIYLNVPLLGQPKEDNYFV